MPAEQSNLLHELEGYGVAPENVRLFGQGNPKPNLQDYLTLHALRRKNKPAPDGVAEYQGRPILYFVDEQRLTAKPPEGDGTLFPPPAEPEELPVIFHQLACRGERVYLARIQFGKLVVAPVTPSSKKPNWVEYEANTTRGRTLFSRLAFGISEGEDFEAGDAVFDHLFGLVKHVANRIARTEQHRPDALSLVGRALFFRFLRDRGVLENYQFKNIAPKALDWTECFRDAKNAADTCAWLDKTFNGEFLKLTDGGNQAFFERLGQETGGEIFKDLSAVVRGHQPAGGDYQPLLDWGWQSFDFAHIPVGLLSQVYEAFSWEWTPKEAKRNSQRYTPRNIAVTLLEEVFDKLPDVISVKLLDPACGAGVFLVLAFRRLYLEHWKRSKNHKRPDTEAIRNILDNQLVGLDISESALKLAALSLYLTAIELDPEPQPPDKLKFKNLRGRVLFDVREPTASKDTSALGSLGAHLGTKFDGQFDVVLSNPPWTSVDAALGARLKKVCKTIIGRTDRTAAQKYVLPDNNPDLPFLWKATEWCKPGGRIAMVLPARILLKTEATPKAAREALFSLVQVDGIINGTTLADTAIWPGIKQPWMLMFATNQRPADDHLTHLVTIPLEVAHNRAGQFRIDSESARGIEPAVAAEKPWLWKALSIGTALDVDVVEKMIAISDEPLERYWKRVVGINRAGKGYQLAETQKGLKRCRFLKGLPNLNATDKFKFAVDSTKLELFTKTRLWRPRKRTIYDAPLTLIKEAPGEDRKKGRALLSFTKVAYNESFTGYSGGDHPDGELLVRYLHLFVHSDIWLYYLLATSPQFGAERRRFHKADLEKCPIPPFDKLTAEQREELVVLSKRLEQGKGIVWSDIDTFFAKLYRLKPNDLQVIKDTLAVALPYDTARVRASSPPKMTDKQAFIAAVRKTLAPFLRAVGKDLVVEPWSVSDADGLASSPFGMLALAAAGTPLNGQEAAGGMLKQIIEIADDTGASQIILQDPPILVVGIYNQYRYWTLSRARLLAGDIIRQYLDVITG